MKVDATYSDLRIDIFDLTIEHSPKVEAHSFKLFEIHTLHQTVLIGVADTKEKADWMHHFKNIHTAIMEHVYLLRKRFQSQKGGITEPTDTPKKKIG